MQKMRLPIVLCSSRIVLGTHAELEPIDIQVSDKVEESQSVLNHVQKLGRLGADFTLL